MSLVPDHSIESVEHNREAGVEQNTTRPRVGIALLGKGATNHLHRPEVVDAFRRGGAQVIFIVREDYSALLEHIPGCIYTSCRFREARGLRAYVHGLFRYVRRIYPTSDRGVREFHRRLARAYGLKQRVMHELLSIVARWRVVMLAIVRIESRLYPHDMVEGLNPSDFDELLVLGTGIYGTELEGVLSLWAEHHHLPVVHATKTIRMST